MCINISNRLHTLLLLLGVWKNYHGEKPKCLRGKVEPEVTTVDAAELVTTGDRLSVNPTEDENKTLLQRTPSTYFECDV